MKRVLLIDDDNIVHIVVKRVLGGDFQVQCALNGSSGIEMMKESLPDLVLMDIRMPDEDGFEVYQRMLKDERLKDVPVIFLTAEEDSSIEEMCLQEGAVDYVKKPFAPRVLYNRVRNAIELTSYRKAAMEQA